MIVIPLLSLMRATNQFDAAELRTILQPPLLLCMLLSSSVVNALIPRTPLQIVLAIVFLQAMLVGAQNFSNFEDIRPYLSHLFQIASAYVMFGVGWMSIGKIGHKFWERFAILTLAAAIISTALTLTALGRGDIARLYTPAYGFIFVAAYSILYSNKISTAVLLSILVSNKRGPFISILAMYIVNFFQKIHAKYTKKQFFNKIITGTVVVIFFTISLIIIIIWASKSGSDSSVIARAINITYGRFADIIQAQETQRTLGEISAGRFDEIESAFASISGLDFFFGAGAGWTITLFGGKQIQNIHFTPLSLVAVFGTPFAVLLYFNLTLLIMRANWRKDDIETLTTMERIAPLYLTGAIVHSLFAYSLFVDLLVFYFVGVLEKSLQYRKHAIIIRKGLA